MTPDVALLEHEVLSQDFLAWLRDLDNLDHDECPICHPPVLDGGLHPDPERRCYTKVITCPLCGILLRESAICLVQRSYGQHLAAKHAR